MAAKNTFGTKFYIGNASNTLNLFPKVVRLSKPSRRRGVLDTTTHDSVDGAAESILDGVYEWSELSVTWNHEVGGDPADVLINQAWDYGDGLFIGWSEKKAPTGQAVWVISARLTEINYGDAPVRGIQTATATFMLSGVRIAGTAIA